MIIKTITEQYEKEAYHNLLMKAIADEPQFFRISPSDMEGEVFPTQDTLENFTLGAFNDDGELVGTVGFRRDTFLKVHHKGLIFRMYVSEKAKGYGLGRKLLLALIERAKLGEGLRQIYLTVISSNQRAINLYSSEGFELYSREKGSIKMDKNEFVDEDSMIKYL